MKNSDGQQDEMQNVFFKLFIGNIAFSAFSWSGFYIFQNDDSKQEWPTGILWIILGFVVFVVCTVLKWRLQGANQFHFLVYLQSLPTAGLLLDSSIRLISTAIKLEDWTLYTFIVFSLAIAVIGSYSQVDLIRVQLKHSLNQNLKTGRLDLKKGGWNLGKQLILESPTSGILGVRGFNWLLKFSPLVTGLTLVFARTIEGTVQMLLFSMSLYVLAYTVIWGYARHLAIAIQLREWEGYYKITITL